MRIAEVLFYSANKVKLLVEMPDPNRCTTDTCPHLPRDLFQMFPHLVHHTCHNYAGRSFQEECQATEIPHLFEHLILELQSQAEPHNGLKGETQWNWRIDPRGAFHVHVEYENQQLVLAAIRLAERVVNAIDARAVHTIDIDRELLRLRQIAALGRDLMPDPAFDTRHDLRDLRELHDAERRPVAAAVASAVGVHHHGRRQVVSVA